jgi:hypothetical protein
VRYYVNNGTKAQALWLHQEGDGPGDLGKGNPFNKCLVGGQEYLMVFVQLYGGRTDLVVGGSTGFKYCTEKAYQKSDVQREWSPLDNPLDSPLQVITLAPTPP